MAFIDDGWARKLTAEETAAVITSSYLRGLARSGHVVEANTLIEAVTSASREDFSGGRIKQECLFVVINTIERVRETLWNYRTESGFYPERARRFMEQKKADSA